ncbi:PIG-L deacetylase family protein [Halopseudomonas bauzanensis]|uniref:PIG-L deacetylase family protein n=1 Tax=Halopseudomonas bauzanensis TaxID=653930 RepID=UPI0035267040
MRKQQLLKKYRRNKRVAMVGILVSLVLVSIEFSLWLFPLGLLLIWLVHEAWFADHLFYSPQADYRYRFPEHTQSVAVDVVNGYWRVECEGDLDQATLIARVELHSSWLGWLLDPVICIGNDRQTFERGARGVRYLNLTGQAAQLQAGGLAVRCRFCSIAPSVKLLVFSQPSPQAEHILILAPHADDAELAAFGLYSGAEKVNIVTLTQGEIEARHYQRLGLGRYAAAQLKGRLRTWDSQAIPLWGGVPQANCVQLGYYCMQLPAMKKQPSQPFGSKESGEADIRTAREFNAIDLPGDLDGQPTWSNLVADLTASLEHFKPDVVVMPHPELDPHADHVATTQAFFQAMELSTWQPKRLFLYANHLHDNDRWPMGDANTGMALPPALIELPADDLFSHVLDDQRQLDKAMALLMHHDLQPPLSLKRRLRRQIQRLLVGRRWPKTGDNEYLRKAVRRHELFWVRELP